jgi:hypothetical protein
MAKNLMPFGGGLPNGFKTSSALLTSILAKKFPKCGQFFWFRCGILLMTKPADPFGGSSPES